MHDVVDRERGVADGPLGLLVGQLFQGGMMPSRLWSMTATNVSRSWSILTMPSATSRLPLLGYTPLEIGGFELRLHPGSWEHNCNHPGVIGHYSNWVMKVPVAGLKCSA